MSRGPRALTRPVREYRRVKPTEAFEPVNSLDTGPLAGAHGGMTTRLLAPRFWIVATLSLGWFTVSWAADAPSMKKWEKGRGWGWVWGKEDELGALNEMTDASRLAALRLVRQGRTYDLGVLYDRTSYTDRTSRCPTPG